MVTNAIYLIVMDDKAQMFHVTYPHLTMDSTQDNLAHVSKNLAASCRRKNLDEVARIG